MRACKRLLSPALIAVILSAAVGVVFAASYSSQNYVFKNLRIVPAGGQSSSADYSLKNIRIGSSFGGLSESSNYILEAYPVKTEEVFPPSCPALNPVVSPTIYPTQLLSGTKDSFSSLYINGYEAVPLDDSTTWSYEVNLNEGENIFYVTSKNIYSLESVPVIAAIMFNPSVLEIAITSPEDGVTIFAEP